MRCNLETTFRFFKTWSRVIVRCRQNNRKLSTSPYKIIFKWLLWFWGPWVFVFISSEDNGLNFIGAAQKTTAVTQGATVNYRPGRYNTMPRAWQSSVLEKSTLTWAVWGQAGGSGEGVRSTPPNRHIRTQTHWNNKRKFNTAQHTRSKWNCKVVKERSPSTELGKKRQALGLWVQKGDLIL